MRQNNHTPTPMNADGRLDRQIKEGHARDMDTNDSVRVDR
jgi:hypothetical protein